MINDAPLTAARPEAPAARGTRKKGVNCGICDDWGTVVIAKVPGQAASEELCPDKCEAAENVRIQRDLTWT